MSNIVEETVLDKNIKMCYTYDALGRVLTRTVHNLCDCCAASTETFSYDAAGNVTTDGCSAYVYDTNNRLTSYQGTSVSYDLDGNMLSDGALTCTYDSSNRLVSAGGHTYTYNAENVRIRNLCEDEDTSYVYNTNCKLSQLLMKTTDNTVTKYVYGLGLIGEETNSNFLTYHFDFRGSTIAITDINGNVTDTFAYDTYGKLIQRTGTSNIIFGYNGKDGVVTDKNGLIYMRARYYSPELRRFINADIIHGGISDSTSLNRYAYVNGNPVSFTDPFGLAKWWQNALKITAAVAVIAALAVVSVATAGTATAVIAGAAAVGGAITGTIGAVSGYVENGVDGAANGFLVGTVSGAVSGAVAASTLNPACVTASNVAIDIGEYAFRQALDGEDITAGGIFITAGTSLIFGNLEIKLKKGFHINYDPKPGWLNKAGDLYNDRQLLEHIIEKEARRANREYAEKKAMQSTMRFNDILHDRLWEYGIDTSTEEIKSLINDVVFNCMENEIAKNQRK